VLIGDAALPIVGRVSMDSMIVDMRDLGESELGCGDLVELIGPGQPVEAVAAAAGTIAYEILTRLGARPQRMFIEAGDTIILPPGVQP
jgi:alanine racemase